MKKIILSMAWILLAMGATAQVTIGSAKTPLAGTLLMLDDGTTGANNENSSKGLGLPRVELKTLTPDRDELAESIGGVSANVPWDEDEHIGLVVYNAKKNGSICPGIHVWDGTIWVALAGDAGGAKPDITMTDTDNNVYNAKWFSADPCDPDAGGAYWTTSNLYTTQNKDGNPFIADAASGLPDGVRINPGKDSTDNGAIPINSTGDFTGNVAYSQSATATATTNQTLSMKDYATKFGLSYTHDQAMQACPQSWSLPDNAAWDALALAHGGASVAGAAMRANNDYYLANDLGTPSNRWGLITETATPSGFNALPSGSVHPDGAHAANFSRFASWWSANTSGSTRDMANFSLILFVSTGVQGGYLSVRCVKN